MTHTTGHWSIHAPAGSDTYLVAAGSQIVFAITKGTIPTREDARLIAAAPDMLAAMRAAMPAIEQWFASTSGPHRRDAIPIYEQFRAAIAKATGEA